MTHEERKTTLLRVAEVLGIDVRWYDFGVTKSPYMGEFYRQDGPHQVRWAPDRSNEDAFDAMNAADLYVVRTVNNDGVYMRQAHRKCQPIHLYADYGGDKNLTVRMAIVHAIAAAQVVIS